MQRACYTLPGLLGASFYVVNLTGKTWHAEYHVLTIAPITHVSRMCCDLFHELDIIPKRPTM